MRYACINTGIIKKLVYSWNVKCSDFPFSYLWGSVGYGGSNSIFCHKTSPTELYLNMNFSITFYPSYLKMVKHSETESSNYLFNSGHAALVLHHSENSGKSSRNLTFFPQLPNTSPTFFPHFQIHPPLPNDTRLFFFLFKGACHWR